MPEPRDRVRIAVVQSVGVTLDAWRATMDSLLGLTGRAADQADIVVLPECAWPAYWLGSLDAYRASRAAGMPSADEFLERLSDLASRKRVHVCAGYVAEEDGELFNRAMLLDRAGAVLGTYDKCFLWGFDRQWFTPGREIRPISTEFGLVGVMVCADARLPEIAATLAARGARLLLQPTAWVNGGSPERLWNPQPEFLIPARARELGVPIASASKCGGEGDTVFVGSSLIVDARGRRQASCEPRGEGFATAEVALPEAARRRRVARRWRLRQDFTLPPSMAQTAHLTVARSGPMGGAEDDDPVGALSCSVSFRALNSSVDETAHGIELYGPTDSVVASGRLRVAAIAGYQAHHFAPARALALQGIHLLVVFGRARVDSLRARAAENRIFVVTVNDRPQAYDPRGLRLGGRPDERALLSLEFSPAEATSKEVAPGTDVFAGRRTDLYEY